MITGTICKEEIIIILNFYVTNNIMEKQNLLEAQELDKIIRVYKNIFQS